MGRPKISKATEKQIDGAVAHFISRHGDFRWLAKTLHNDLAENDSLRPFIHSTKFRPKDPKHLRDKLGRIAVESMSKGKPLNITADNLFHKIDDLAGVRLLHLHTVQMNDMHPLIMDILKEHRYTLVRKPKAYTWDIESERIFKNMGLKTERDDSMYTSVHYVVQANRITKMRCELQVRTLMEEVWGEVSHTINYPYETESIACREQLKVLARIASGCTRLVDSIFVSYAEHKSSEKKKAYRKRARKPLGAHSELDKP